MLLPGILFCQNQNFQFLAENHFGEKVSSQRASQGEQNSVNFSFVAPSSEGLRAFKIHCGNDLYHDCVCEASHNSSLECAIKLKFEPFCFP